MRVARIRVGKGRTSRPSEEEEWIREYYELEVEIADDRELPDVRNWALAQIDSWLGKAPTEYIPRLDIAELDECPWQTYQKEPAKPGHAAWIKNPVYFTGWKDPPPVLLELVKALKRSPDEKLVLGDCEYSFSGKGDMKDHFISRRPVKVNK